MAIRSVGDNPLLTGVNLVDSVATAFTVRLLMILRSIFRIFCTAASGYSHAGAANIKENPRG
jgi:hypothetical protein